VSRLPRIGGEPWSNTDPGRHATTTHDMGSASRGPSAWVVGLALVAMGLGGSPLVLSGQQPGAAQEPPDGQQTFRFTTGVELINVTATVTDTRGRFVQNLQQEDFLIYEDGELQEVTYFSNERVPVSLGIVLDTSGSMEGEKMFAAREALDRFLYDLLDPLDEIFLYRFSYQPTLVHGWTSDRDRLSRAMRSIRPRGGTALYDAVADSVPMAQEGVHRKKAIVLISDGNDTNSETDLRDVQQLIRETEVLVYAIGIDVTGRSSGVRVSQPQPRRRHGRPGQRVGAARPDGRQRRPDGDRPGAR
jgi:Ca-activated chloride channel family protein